MIKSSELKAELDAAKERSKPFWQRCQVLQARYLPTQKNKLGGFKPYLWGNLETVLPNIFFKLPQPRVIRRQVKKTGGIKADAAQVLEQAIVWSLEQQAAEDAYRAAILDYLLLGRGVVWHDYEPTIKTIQQPVPYDQFGNPLIDPALIKEKNGELIVEAEQLVKEIAKISHVYYSDFLHSNARLWADVQWIGRAVYLTRSQIKEKFGSSVIKDLTFDHSKSGVIDLQKSEDSDYFGLTKIWEVYNKVDETRCFIADNSDKYLSCDAPPVVFNEFFPCPRPLFATQEFDSLETIGDAEFYQRSLTTLDTIERTIAAVVPLVEFRAVANKQFQDEINAIMRPGGPTIAYTEQWLPFKEKNAWDGNVLAFPIDLFAKVLEQLYTAKDRELRTMYEISGLADLLRGQGDAEATATAERIKGNYAGLRLACKQKEVERFLRDSIAILGEQISELYQPETLALCVGAEVDETFLPIVDLLRNDKLRSFVIDVETNSTIRANEQENKEATLELVNTLTELFQRLLQFGGMNPNLLRIAKEAMLTAVKAFDGARTLEEQIEQAFDGLIEQASQPPPQPPPDPNVAIIQLEQQKAAQKGQIEEAKLQLDIEDRRADNIRADKELMLKYGVGGVANGTL